MKLSPNGYAAYRYYDSRFLTQLSAGADGRVWANDIAAIQDTSHYGLHSCWEIERLSNELDTIEVLEVFTTLESVQEDYPELFV